MTKEYQDYKFPTCAHDDAQRPLSGRLRDEAEYQDRCVGDFREGSTMGARCRDRAALIREAVARLQALEQEHADLQQKVTEAFDDAVLVEGTHREAILEATEGWTEECLKERAKAEAAEARVVQLEAAICLCCSQVQPCQDGCGCKRD